MGWRFISECWLWKSQLIPILPFPHTRTHTHARSPTYYFIRKHLPRRKMQSSRHRSLCASKECLLCSPSGLFHCGWLHLLIQVGYGPLQLHICILGWSCVVLSITASITTFPARRCQFFETHIAGAVVFFDKKVPLHYRLVR